MNQWLKLALKIAQNSNHKCHKLGAIVVRGGSVLSSAANISKPFGLDNRGRHAEVRALLPHRDFCGATLYVARIGWRMSRPCNECWEAIREAKISKVVYIDWFGQPQIEAVR